mmetsp:Transcript_56835/g.144072  ORF Transcript_56835/g.144072 Transcript_56835/m.144072 type:complete len:105 (-) Transcript_56835:396-710(-)
MHLECVTTLSELQAVEEEHNEMLTAVGDAVHAAASASSAIGIRYWDWRADALAMLRERRSMLTLQQPQQHHQLQQLQQRRHQQQSDSPTRKIQRENRKRKRRRE